jgi:hypothetical protein
MKENVKLTEIVRRLNPEEEELARKREGLAAIKTSLAEREFELADLNGQLADFEAVYPVASVSTCTYSSRCLYHHVGCRLVRQDP